MVDHNARFQVLEWEVASLRQALAITLGLLERKADDRAVRDELSRLRQGLDKQNPHMPTNPTPGECHFCGKETTGLLHTSMGVTVFACPDPCIDLGD